MGGAVSRSLGSNHQPSGQYLALAFLLVTTLEQRHRQSALWLCRVTFSRRRLQDSYPESRHVGNDELAMFPPEVDWWLAEDLGHTARPQQMTDFSLSQAISLAFQL